MWVYTGFHDVADRNADAEVNAGDLHPPTRPKPLSPLFLPYPTCPMIFSEPFIEPPSLKSFLAVRPDAMAADCLPYFFSFSSLPRFP